MIARLFLNLTDYPAFRRFIWKPIYETIAKRIIIPDWQFMNYGYAPGALEEPLILLPEDEVNRYSIQLYHYLIAAVNISEKEILEVGSGRGGGANYIHKYLKPGKITGLDIAFNAVKLANKKHAGRGLKFTQGNAEQLPFGDEVFDVILNVESCHAYGSVPAFFNEVKRVLRPGGYFLCTDMRSPNGMQTLKRNLGAMGMYLSMENDITQNVLKAIEEEEPLKQQRISDNIPAWCSKIFKEFAGVKGSKIYEDLRSGALIYHRFVLQKISSKTKNYHHEKDVNSVADVNDSPNITAIL